MGVCFLARRVIHSLRLVFVAGLGRKTGMRLPAALEVVGGGGGTGRVGEAGLEELVSGVG